MGQQFSYAVKKPAVNSPTAMANAAKWNAPGGGYDQWRAGDPQREQAQPVGTIPGVNPQNDYRRQRPRSAHPFGMQMREALQ